MSLVPELCDALALGPGGIQINVTEKGYTVSTRYRPYITKRAPTLLEALELVHIAGYQRFRPTRVAVALHEFEQRNP
jgi:hypothetical protein